jgi:hypothetical protein
MSKRRSSTKGSPLDPVFFVDADLCDYVFLDILRGASIRLEVHDDHFAKGTDDLDWDGQMWTLPLKLRHPPRS